MLWSLAFFLPIFGSRCAQATSPHRLQLTAVVSDEDQNAAFECWEISTPFSDYPTTGTAINGLAEVSNISYVVLPPGSNEGIHKPPHPMFFALLSGSAHITLPAGNDELWITNDENRLIVAVDTVGVGHVTEYPSSEPAIALQIPFKDGVVPDHRVLQKSPCDATAPIAEPERDSSTQVDELR